MLSEEKLIQFDYKVILLVMVCCVLFMMTVVFKLHGSSIPHWNALVSDGNDSHNGLIVGQPRSIRSDEWLVQTPFILSQLNQVNKYPLKNKSLGEGDVPLLMNLPVWHVTTFFKPQNWGFFFLGAERGFSFYWNFRVIGLFLSFFLLLMLISRNKFWISLFGSIWLCFSSLIQWFFINDIVTAFSIIFISIAYIFLSKRKSSIIIATAFLAIFSGNFILTLYPPFQVTMAYLLLFMLIGFLLENITISDLKEYLILRISGILAAMVILAGGLISFYIDAKSAISLTMNTIYPGRRILTGGKISIAQFFSGFYGIFMREQRFPTFMGNISEASSLIFLYPLAFLFAAYRFTLKKKNGFFLIFILAYLAIFTVWVLYGFPMIIAKTTFFDFTSSVRALLGLGVAGIMALVVIASQSKEIIRNKRALYLILLTIFLLIFAHGLALKEMAPVFTRYSYVLVVAGFFTFLSYLFLKGKHTAFFALVASFAFASTFFVNPISIGLSPIYGKNLFKFSQAENQKDPNNFWVVYGNHVFADFLKVSGANVLNGTQYTPKLKYFAILDPGGKNKAAYDRYAHFSFSQPQTNTEVVKFKLVAPDDFDVTIDPCSQKLSQIGINRLLFTYKPNEKKLSCLVPMSNNPISGAWIYKRK